MTRTSNPPTWMVPAAVLLGLVLILMASRQAMAWWVRGQAGEMDALEWVEREFRPTASAMAEMREVHRRYAPRRQAVAARLAEQRDRLIERAVADGDDSAAFHQEASRWDALAAESHDLTWQYLFEMAKRLPDAEAQRFRRELARVVLGLPQGEPGEVSR